MPSRLFSSGTVDQSVRESTIAYPTPFTAFVRAVQVRGANLSDPHKTQVHFRKPTALKHITALTEGVIGQHIRLLREGYLLLECDLSLFTLQKGYRAALFEAGFESDQILHIEVDCGAVVYLFGIERLPAT